MDFPMDFPLGSFVLWVVVAKLTIESQKNSCTLFLLWRHVLCLDSHLLRVIKYTVKTHLFKVNQHNESK